MKSITAFNNKGGIGTTSLVHHLAWMFTDLGARVLAVDLDPQANLSSMFLNENRLDELWDGDEHPQTILGVIQPLLEGIGDIAQPHIEQVHEKLGLIVGDLGLSGFEGKLSDSWPKCLDGDVAAFRTLTSFYRAVLNASITFEAELVLIDIGPNLGAINRSAMIGVQHILLPLAPDLFSLQGLKNLGPTLRQWRFGWKNRLDNAPKRDDLPLPEGKMEPMGYVVMQPGSVRNDRPVKSYQYWMNKIPAVYRESVLMQEKPLLNAPPVVTEDPYYLMTLKHYRSLMPLAMDARKPMFHLKSADGAIGSHLQAVQSCYGDFKTLALKITERCDLHIAP